MTESPLIFRCIERTDLVENFRVGRQGNESVREHSRDVKLGSVLRRKLYGHVLQIGRRILPEIDDHVAKRAARAANQLGLCGWWHLVVHAAQRSRAAIDRSVALDEVRIEPVLRKLARAKRTREESSFVLAPLELDYECSLEACFSEAHPTNSSRTRC